LIAESVFQKRFKAVRRSQRGTAAVDDSIDVLEKPLQTKN